MVTHPSLLGPMDSARELYLEAEHQGSGVRVLPSLTLLTKQSPGARDLVLW